MRITLTPDMFTTYPDGQQDITKHISNRWVDEDDTLTIVSRMNSFLDIERILLAVKYFRGYYDGKVNLEIPYLLGARGDRDFGWGVAYLRDIIAPILNGLNLQQITCLHPHSVVAQNVIPNLRTMLSPFGKILKEISGGVIVAPDAGAAKSGDEMRAIYRNENDLVLCTKKRDKDGRIIETIVYCDDFQGKDIYIFDDICSYGSTFRNIAKIIKERNAGKIYLVVSHYEGVANLDEMRASGIEHIYTTNSICDIEHPMITQTKII